MQTTTIDSPTFHWYYLFNKGPLLKLNTSQHTPITKTPYM